MKLLTSFIAAVVLATAGAAQATPRWWALFNLTFDDLAQGDGLFVYDDSNNQFSYWRISVSAASFMPAYTYESGEPGNSVGIHNATQVDFVAFPPGQPSRYLRLAFASPLDQWRDISLKSSGESYECDNCSNFRYVTSGHVASMPEPSTVVLMVAGVGLVGFMARRRKA